MNDQEIKYCPQCNTEIRVKGNKYCSFPCSVKYSKQNHIGFSLKRGPLVETREELLLKKLTTSVRKRLWRDEE